jgi:hypothetical protein
VSLNFSLFCGKFQFNTPTLIQTEQAMPCVQASSSDQRGDLGELAVNLRLQRAVRRFGGFGDRSRRQIGV